MRLLESGVQLEDECNLMGHEDINITLNHYTLIDPQRVKILRKEQST
ncbi:MAG TPA: hypothetical protein VEC36_01930 [Patescibacteria group bacterium]|nr:hypothetical protein [Patescibacteria group bacterium]